MLESLASSMGLVGVLIIGLIAMVILYGAAELVKRLGKRQPANADYTAAETCKAVVTGKRMHGRIYYATFQNEQGDREELELSGEAYGLLAEGDKGLLTKMDGQFAGFERNRE